VTHTTDDLVHRLRAALERRAPATLTDAQAHRAAVAVIVTAGPDPAMLFVKRRERTGDPWSGHVAFPGGFAEPSDGSPMRTAIRETVEETGLTLGPESLLGTLDDVYPRSALLPKVIVTPVAFSVPAPAPVTAREEIAAVMWFPVAQVFAPENRRPLEIPLPSGSRVFESIVIGGVTIWGLTERILAQLLPFI
jgi:8-oxo-dGTP pyrophosphatase MutT (NUDIX family)